MYIYVYACIYIYINRYIDIYIYIFVRRVVGLRRQCRAGVWCQIEYKGVEITCSTLQMCVLLIINEQKTTSITAAGAPTHIVRSLCDAVPSNDGLTTVAQASSCE